MIVFQPTSFQTWEAPTTPQKYLPSLNHKMGSLIKCSFIRTSLIIPSEARDVATIPVTMIQDKKCGRYEIVWTVLFQKIFLISFSNKASIIAVIKPSTRLMKPIATVLRSTRRKLSSVNRNLNCLKPIHSC
ncbi:hypothetical protein D3C76_464990 [compost metagenome]